MLWESLVCSGIHHTCFTLTFEGSDVSRDAANLILLDDNFASVVHGVEEGMLQAHLLLTYGVALTQVA